MDEPDHCPEKPLKIIFLSRSRRRNAGYFPVPKRNLAGECPELSAANLFAIFISV